jgi:exosortase/archaeosortase family protein
VAFTFITFIMQDHWELFSGLVLRGAHALLALILGGASMDAASFSLGARGFSVIVGSPCSGITSLSMFAGIFLLLAVLDRKRLRPGMAAALFLLGLAGAFAVNIMRIAILVAIGAIGHPELALDLFHTNAGWVFFVAYTLGFLWLAYPRMLAKASKN